MRRYQMPIVVGPVEGRVDCKICEIGLADVVAKFPAAGPAAADFEVEVCEQCLGMHQRANVLSTNPILKFGIDDDLITIAGLAIGLANPTAAKLAAALGVSVE